MGSDDVLQTRHEGSSHVAPLLAPVMEAPTASNEPVERFRKDRPEV